MTISGEGEMKWSGLRASWGGSGMINACGISHVVIEDGITSMPQNAFYSCRNFTIYGKAGSYAESYTKQNNIPFIELIEVDEEQTDTAYEKGSSKGVTIKCFAESSDLRKVYVDGVEIGAVNYTLEEADGRSDQTI